MTTKTTARVGAIKRDDWNITLRFLAAELGVSYGSAQSIMHEELGGRECCARWVPHLLTDHQHAERARICCQWLKMFDFSPTKRFSSLTKRLPDVDTGDECWTSFFTNKDKASNMVWILMKTLDLKCSRRIFAAGSQCSPFSSTHRASFRWISHQRSQRSTRTIIRTQFCHRCSTIGQKLLQLDPDPECSCIMTMCPLTRRPAQRTVTF